MSEEQKIAYIDTMITKTAQAMRKQMLLPKNMEKGLWFTMTDEEIIDRINQELDELKYVIKTRPWTGKREKIIKESADVCNFLGFLIDNQGGDI